MFAFWHKFRKAKKAQQSLRAAFKNRGQNFMTMESSVHEALVKEAIVTGVEATMQHFSRIEAASLGRVDYIIEHYKERSRRFDR